MAKKKESPIALELERFEKKIKQFQDYLEAYDVNQIFEDTIRHREITVQKDLMKALGELLGQLASLREQEEKIQLTRGDVDINPRMKNYGSNV